MNSVQRMELGRGKRGVPMRAAIAVTPVYILLVAEYEQLQAKPQWLGVVYARVVFL